FTKVKFLNVDSGWSLNRLARVRSAIAGSAAGADGPAGVVAAGAAGVAGAPAGAAGPAETAGAAGAPGLIRTLSARYFSILLRWTIFSATPLALLPAKSGSRSSFTLLRCSLTFLSGISESCLP